MGIGGDGGIVVVMIGTAVESVVVLVVMVGYLG